MKAFFYKNNYYLFPGSVSSVEELLDGDSAVAVRRLKESGCKAPVFIAEEIEDELLFIEDPDLVFETDVQIIPRCEYQAQLYKRKRFFCGNCIFCGEEESPACEMTLDGVCYNKQTKNYPYQYALLSQALFTLCARRKKFIKRCVRHKWNRQLRRIFHPFTKYLLIDSPYVASEYRDGRYTVCFTALHDTLRSSILCYFCNVLNGGKDGKREKIFGDSFTFVPYLKKGVFRYSKREYGVDFVKNPPKLHIIRDDEGLFCGLNVFVPVQYRKNQKKQDFYSRAIYYYLCSEIGEDKLVSFLQDFSPTESDADCVDVQTVRQEIEATATTVGYESYPNPMYAERSDADRVPSKLPFKQNGYVMGTTTPEITLRFLEEDLNEDNTAFEIVGLHYAYLFVPTDGEEEQKHRMEVLNRYLALYEDVLLQTECTDRPVECHGIGFMLCDDGFSVDFLVGEENAFFNRIRALAPVLKSWRAKLVVVKRSGTIIYRCGYVLEPENTGIFN